MYPRRSCLQRSVIRIGHRGTQWLDHRTHSREWANNTMPPHDPPMSRWIDGLISATRLSIRVASWAAIVTAICMLPWVWRRFNPLHTSKVAVDLSQNMTITHMKTYCVLQGKNALDRLWCAAPEFLFTIAIPFYVVLPCAAYILYLSPGPRISSLWLLLSFIVIFLIDGLVVLNPSYEVRQYIVIAGASSALVPILVLKLSQPKDSKMWLQALKALWVYLGSMVFMGFYDKFSRGPLLFLCLVWPISREVICYFARSITCLLATDPDVAGTGVNVRQEYASLMLLCTQTSLAIWYRLVVTEMDTTEEFLFFLLCSTITELTLRLTIVRRQETISCIVNRWFKLFKRPKSSIQPSPSLGTEEERLNKQKDKKAWAAQLVLVEIISEYIGIFVSIALVLMHRDAIMMLPLPLYKEIGRPFDHKLDIGKFLFRQGTQILIELFVDATCLTIEQISFKHPIDTFWTGQSSRSKLINLVLGASTGLALAWIIMDNGAGMISETQECYATDWCSCAPPKQNLVGMYCQRLYPETNGLPPR